MYPEMPVPPPASSLPETHLGEGAEAFDFDWILDYASFVMDAIRSQRLLELGVFASVVVIAGLAVVSLPKTYHAETKLLAQRNELIESLSLNSPNRSGAESDPTRAASETVLRNDNLIALVEQTDVIRHWDSHRAPILRVKDWLMRLVRAEPSREDKIALFVDLLQARLSIAAAEGAITIAIDWNDPAMAFRLVEAAEQSFLEARHVRDISSITDAISILENHTQNVQRDIDQALDELQERQQSKSKVDDAVSVARPQPPRRSVAKEAPNPEYSSLHESLESNRKSIQDLEDFRRHRLDELMARKAEWRAIYAEAHPAMVGLQQSIEAQGQDSPRLTQLRAEEAELMSKLKALGTPAAPLPVASRPAAPMVSVQLHDKEDPASEYAANRLRYLVGLRDRLVDRIQTARITLDTTRAGFKYRYTVIRPPQFPKNGKPTKQGVLGGGIIAGLLLAVFAAVFAELHAGRIVAGWQVERTLGLSVLGELDT
jgi:uncharacterized protein involved in exopolysaccharide biosynthesis